MSVEIGSIFCVGRNFRAHAAEMGNEVPTKPLIFIKNINCLQSIENSHVAWGEDLVHYEAELVVRIGSDLKRGEKIHGNVFSHFTLGLDLTKREVQSHCKQSGHPWFAAKCFTGSALVGQWLKWDSVCSLSDLNFEFVLNGQMRQKGITADMIFTPKTIVNHLLQSLSLRRGDIVFTGTPEGVGPISKGDRVALNFPKLNQGWESVIG